MITAENQMLGAESAHQTREFLRGLLDKAFEEGRPAKMVLSGAAAAVVELIMHMRPEGLSAEDSQMAIVAMVYGYCEQIMELEKAGGRVKN